MTGFIKALASSWLYITIASFVLIACNARQESKNEANETGLIDTLQSEIDLSDITIGYSTPSLNAPFYVVLSQVY